MEPDDYDYWPARALKDPEAVLQKLSVADLILHIERARVFNDLTREGVEHGEIEDAYVLLLDRLTGWCAPEVALKAPEPTREELEVDFYAFVREAWGFPGFRNLNETHMRQLLIYIENLSRRNG